MSNIVFKKVIRTAEQIFYWSFNDVKMIRLRTISHVLYEQFYSSHIYYFSDALSKDFKYLKNIGEIMMVTSY